MNIINEEELLRIWKEDGRHDAVHSETFRLRSSEVDSRGWVHLSVILSFFEEIAHGHTLVYGMEYGQLQNAGYTWLLNRMGVEILRLPAWLDEIKIYTWQSDANRAGFFRDYYVFDSEGEPLIAASSFWVVTTLAEHKIVDPSIAMQFGHNDAPVILGFKALAKPIKKLRRNFADFSNDEVSRTKRIIGFSDLDINNHVNNTNYISIARDAVDLVVPNGYVNRFDISYTAELLKNDLIEVETIITDEVDDSATVAVRARVINNEEHKDVDSFRIEFSMTKRK